MLQSHRAISVFYFTGGTRDVGSKPISRSYTVYLNCGFYKR
jgi:hypothetical protein